MAAASRAAAVIGAALTAAALTTGPPAGAARISVSPGDRITSPDVCTIAHTYTGRDGRAYALTAGHCHTSGGHTVRDERTGATGTFVRTAVDPPGSGGADYGLIDFGVRTLALTFIGNQPIAPHDHPRPRPGQTVCRTGVATGQHCGTVLATHGQDQYLTTGMPPSRGGDSGGPVWMLRSDGYAQVVGIWLGGRKNRSGDDNGRFASLAAGIDTLDIAPSNING